MKYLIICALLLSCNNPQEQEPAQKKFPLTYKCVINDPTIEATTITRASYFPDKGYTQYGYHTFQRSDFKQGIEIIDTVYIGVTREAHFSVIRDWGDSQGNYWKYYLLKKDTILTDSDSLYLFTYPQDTLKAIGYKTQFDKEWTYL